MSSKYKSSKELSKFPYLANASSNDRGRQFSLEDIERGSKIGKQVKTKDPPPSYDAVRIMEDPPPGYYEVTLQKKFEGV